MEPMGTAYSGIIYHRHSEEPLGLAVELTIQGPVLNLGFGV